MEVQAMTWILQNLLPKLQSYQAYTLLTPLTDKGCVQPIEQIISCTSMPQHITQFYLEIINHKYFHEVHWERSDGSNAHRYALCCTYNYYTQILLTTAYNAIHKSK